MVENIDKLAELRLYLYFTLKMIVTSPMWMNMVILNVFIVEQLIIICALLLIYIAIYIR